MASDKKPSMYSGYPDHGKVGSAEELEAYGVWVKSEPQDFTASLAEAANFNADALPYEADFDTGFDDMGMGTAGFDMLEPELHIPEMSIEDEGIDRGSEEASSQLLMKIAGELSSIRSELNTLKKEFAEIRGDNAGETEAGGEGDKAENFFNTADFPTEEEMGFDPGRAADEAALKELDAQNEAEEINVDFDNLGIDLDGVGAVEEIEAAEEEAPQEELPPLEAVTDDDDFEMPSFDPLSFEEAPPSESEEIDEAAQGFAEELVPLVGEDEELKELRLEGAESLAPPPDNADYLEEDPFVNVTALSEETAPGDAVGDTLSGESAQPETAAEVSEPAVSEPETAETAPSAEEDLAFEGLSFDEASFDLGEGAGESEAEENKEPLPDDIPLDLSEKIVEPPLEEPVLEDISFEDDISLDMGEFEADIGLDTETEEPAAEEPAAEETAVEEAAAGFELAEQPDDLGAIELDATAEEPAAEEIEAGFELAEQPEETGAIELDAAAEEPVAEEIETGFELEEQPAETGADIALDASADDLGTVDLGEDIVLDAPVEDLETVDLGGDVALDAPADEPGTVDLGEDIALDASADDLGTVDLGGDVALDIPADDLGTVDLGEDVALDASADDLGTVDLGEDAALDTQPDDLETLDLGEDIVLDTQIEDIETVDFGDDLAPAAALEPEAELAAIPPTKAAAKPDRAPAAPANDIISDVDDSVIPEGFEVNAKEADPSVDDDLEAFADGELTIAEDENPSDSADKLADDSGEFSAIPVGLKNELKNVLSYMDHLLESLPEEKIEEFAQSEYFDKYKKIFKELGLV